MGDTAAQCAVDILSLFHHVDCEAAAARRVGCAYGRFPVIGFRCRLFTLACYLAGPLEYIQHDL